MEEPGVEPPALWVIGQPSLPPVSFYKYESWNDLPQLKVLHVSVSCESNYVLCLLTPCQSGRDLQHYQGQAKQLCRRLNAQSPDRCTLEAGDMNFQ